MIPDWGMSACCRAQDNTCKIWKCYLHDVSVAFFELLQPVQDDQLDVVVRLGNQQLAEAVGSSSDGSWGLAQGHQGDSAFIHHSRAGAL